MKIITTLLDDNYNVLAKIETIGGDLEAHEEKLGKIQHAIDETIESLVEQDMLNNYEN